MTRRALRTLALSVSVLGGLTLAQTAHAQLVPGTPYQLSRTPITYQPLSSPTVIWTDVDDSGATVALPFPVTYYNTTLTSLAVDSNGAIGFPGGTSVTRFNRAPGTAGTPAGVIGVFWTDLELNPATGNYVGWQVEGTAPNRTLTVEYRNISFYFDAASSMSMQVRFYEGASGRIDIDYGTLVGTRSNVVMGMDNPMNQQPILFPVSQCTNNCTNTDWPTNTRISVTQDPGVELVAASVEAPEFGFLGAQTQVPVTVQSLHGNAIGPFTVEVVASQTPNLANPVSIGTATMDLGPFERETLNVTTVPPQSLGVGAVYLGLNVDSNDDITEVDETNNTIASLTPIRLIQGAADLAVQRVRTSQSMIASGDTIDVTTTVQNVGGEPAPATDVAIMLSTNPVISAQDVLLDTYSVTLADGQVDMTTRPVTIPAQTNSGTYYIGALADPMRTLTELSESNNGLADDNVLVVAGGALAITTSRLPAAAIQVPYNVLVQAVGGDANDRTWSISAGSLPAGLDISMNTGEIFGRPTMAQMSQFTVQLVSGGETATRQLTLTVNDPTEPLTIVTRTIADAVVGQEYTFPLVSTGGAGTSSVSWTATGLPDGFTIANNGVIAGTPLMAGSSTITVMASKGAETASRDLNLRVRNNAGLLIVPEVLPTAQFEVAYSAQLSSTGGVQPILWTVDQGQLPAGLALTTDGEISGTPLEAGRFSFVVAARDSTPGNPATDANTFEITVDDDGGLTIPTTMLPEGVINTGYDASIEAMGGTPPYMWRVVEGRIPTDFVATPNAEATAFQIRGQTMEAGTSNFIVEVMDSASRTAVKAFSIRILETAPVVEMPPVDEGCSCTETEGRGGASALLLLVGLFVVARRRR
ncbi:MAG: putative Ig domain-containing protein [Deltaproteobacteria bacterium]